jgi:8-oxo-dGTP diphosphatase
MHPRVGVAVLIHNSNEQILLGLRIGIHGNGMWAPPGGHLEFGESITACASRELAEETNLTLLNPVICNLTEDVFKDSAKHYVTIFVKGTYLGTLMNKEPDKCERWDWFSMDMLPMPLFLPFEQLVVQSPYLINIPARPE